MTIRTPTYLKSVFENGDTPQQADYGDLIDSFFPFTASGKQTLDINLEVTGVISASSIRTNDIVVGDAGSEGSGIDINGTTYNSTFKVSDINGSHFAQTILHRHSTTLEPLIVGARSNSNTTAHATMTSGQNVFSIYGAGWAGSSYKLFSSIAFSSETNGAISGSSSPGRIVFSVTPAGSVSPVEAVRINSNKDVTFASDILVSAVRQSVNSSVAATGTNTAAAKSIFEAINVIRSVTSGSQDALIIGKSEPGMTQIIINDASASAKVYPTSGSKFNQLGNGAPFDIPDRRTCAIYHITSAQYFTATLTR